VIENSLDDKQIVKLLQAGNEVVFDQTVKRFSARVFSLSYRLTKSLEDSEEVLQDTFVSVYRKIRNFEGKSSLSSWIYRITVNTALMKLRKRKSDRHCSLEDKFPDYRNSLMLKDESYKLAGLKIGNEIEKAILSLPQEYRAILVLRDIDGLSTNEVCEILDLSPATIKSRLHRARLILRDQLKSLYHAGSSEILKAA
jgi:RNA polymerase sigma-70 factor (ECF subfamily)